MVIDVVRTTAFRLKDEHFGEVFAYRPGERFSAAWRALGDWWRARLGGESKYLPYGGLAVALRALSGDFVAFQRRVEGSQYLILSRKEIRLEDLSAALQAWERAALKLTDRRVSAFVHDVSVSKIAVASLVRRRPQKTPKLEGGSWPWEVAIWEAAHRLAACPLETDASACRLRVDSDASLLTWEAPIEHEKGRVGAIHKILPKLITIPGIEDPVLSLQSGLVRLATSWAQSRGSKYAWASLADSAPILRARVRHRPRSDGGFEAIWDDLAAEVVKALSIDPLPDVQLDPSINGILRAGFSKQPSSVGIGRGVGAWFHEMVAHHARAALGESARPLVLKSRRASWPTRDRAAPRTSEAHAADQRSVELIVAYANSETRRRVRDSLGRVLLDDAPDDERKALGEFVNAMSAAPDGSAVNGPLMRVRFIRPPEAERFLLKRSERDALVAWTNSWLSPLRLSESSRAVMIIETDESAANGESELTDPKHVLRLELAKRGIVTQFISGSSAPNARATRDDDASDHAAENAVLDALRSTGFFLRPFPIGEGIEPGTLIVGIHGTRVTRQRTGLGRTAYTVNLVAACAGTRTAYGYSKKRGWKPLHDATADFLANEVEMPQDAARVYGETAISQLRVAYGDAPKLLLFDAVGCRQFWPCLQDQSDGTPDRWMVADGSAVVRVRANEDEVLRASGNGKWGPTRSPATYTEFRPMDVLDADGKAPAFVLSGSAVMNRMISARSGTRFTCNARGLGDDWHALGTTELLVLSEGAWSADVLLDHTAILCRASPTWDRVLRWPAPLHLARAIVRNHPLRLAGPTAESVSDDASQHLRLDL